MSNVANLPAAPAAPAAQRQITPVISVAPIYDTARFDHMMRIANVMAFSSLLPESLTHTGTKDNKERLPDDMIKANAFLVVNQAERWGTDPFALAAAVSVVHGKLCYEGKVIAGVLEAKLGVRLSYEWSGAGEQRRIVVSGVRPGESEPRTISGTVSDWKTTGSNSPWKVSQYDKMLAYRGAREWARLWAPGMMVGVYTPDELADMADDARGRSARVVGASSTQPSLASRFSSPAGGAGGFSLAHVRSETATEHDPETGEITGQGASTDEPDETRDGPSHVAQADDAGTPSPEAPVSSATLSRSPESQALFDKLAAKASGGMKKLKMAIGGLSIPEEDMLNQADREALEAIAAKADLGVGA